MSAHHVTTCDVLVRHGNCTCPKVDPNAQRLGTWLAGFVDGNVDELASRILHESPVADMLAHAWHLGFDAGADRPIEDDE